MVFTPLSLPCKKKILVKEHGNHLKVGYIAAALALRAKCSMDQKNFEIPDLKIKPVAPKARKKSLCVYSQL